MKPNNDLKSKYNSNIDDILLDNYKARYYNLINSLNNLFKGIAGKWQQKTKNKN